MTYDDNTTEELTPDDVQFIQMDPIHAYIRSWLVQGYNDDEDCDGDIGGDQEEVRHGAKLWSINVNT